MTKNESIIMSLVVLVLGMGNLFEQNAGKIDPKNVPTATEIQSSIQNSVQSDIQRSVQSSIQNSIQNSLQSSLQGSIQSSLQNSIQNTVQNTIENGIEARGEHIDVDIDHDDYDSYSEKETETIRNSFPVSGNHKTVEVDNVFGSIEISAGSTDKVELVVNKTIRARSKEKIEAAKRDVTLDTSEENNTLQFFVDGPFRCGGNGGCNCNCRGRGDGVHIHGDEGYMVQMDFQIKVPANTDLLLKTVNNGNIHVKGVHGNFEVHNVNGGIEMLDVSGSGKARTINGPVKVTFTENPQNASEFYSLNGDVDLEFARNLSADFYFKTFNGNVYTDFALSALPTATTTERKNGKFIIRTNRSTGGRVGNGGPEIHVENFNGDIHVLEHSL